MAAMVLKQVHGMDRFLEAKDFKEVNNNNKLELEMEVPLFHMKIGKHGKLL